MRVSVAGFGKAFRMDFDEVFVSADEEYQIRHIIYDLVNDGHQRGASCTYNQFWRDGRFQSIRDLMRICADTPSPCAHIPECFTQALLSSMATFSAREGIVSPIECSYPAIPSRLPAILLRNPLVCVPVVIWTR